MKKHYESIIYKGEELIRNGLVWKSESYTLDEYTVGILIEEGSKDIIYQ